MKRKQPLIVVLGETASGKSALAMEIARRYNGELVCADSWTVYKGFDVGTAKPSTAERAEIPHHLLDIADPKEGFSAAEFKRSAEAVIDEINSRGKLPILVGGTGLYIDSILFDYGFLAKPSETLRSKLEAMGRNELLLLAEQKGLNTSTIDQRNKRRIIRLIENDGEEPSRSSLRQDTLIVGLSVPREELEARITARVDAMLADGLEHEVRGLSEQYGWDSEPMKGIGYIEWKDQFEGVQTPELTRERIIAGTKRLAKKQRTWFKRNDSIYWATGTEVALEYVRNWLSTSSITTNAPSAKKIR